MMNPIARRRSIRKYLAKPIEETTVLSLLESARVSPSGSNTQPWHFIVVRDESIKQALAKVSHNQEWMLSAPLFIACVADMRALVQTDEEIRIDEMSPQNEVKRIIRDTAIATEHIVLEATNQGLGTCWVAWFVQNEIRPILGLSADKYLVAILTVGYPAEEPTQRKRSELKDMVHYDRW